MATATKSDLKHRRHNKSHLSGEHSMPSRNERVYSSLRKQMSREVKDQIYAHVHHGYLVTL